jgi:hypothetical protein
MFKVVYECEGDVDFGIVGHVPADARLHDPLPADFIDSHQAVAPLGTASRPSKARLTMRLLNLKSPRFKGHPVVWQVKTGSEWDWVDARDGKVLGVTK